MFHNTTTFTSPNARVNLRILSRAEGRSELEIELTEDNQSVLDAVGKKYLELEPVMRRYMDNRAEYKVIQPRHLHMAMVLQAVHEAYKEEGYVMDSQKGIPKEMDAVMQEAAKYWHDQPQKVFPDFYATFQPEGDFATDEKVGDIRFRAKSALELYLLNCSSDAVLGDIAPKNRWCMCIDPKKIDALQELGIDTKTNRLLGFVFDYDQSYLSRMLYAWKINLKNVDAPLSSDLIFKLNGACQGKIGRDSFDDDRGPNFCVTIGISMNERGRDELMSFGREVRKHIPLYSVGLSLWEYASDISLPVKDGELTLEQAREKLDKLDITGEQAFQICRPPVEAGTLKKKSIPGSMNTTRHQGKRQNRSWQISYKYRRPVPEIGAASSIH